MLKEIDTNSTRKRYDRMAFVYDLMEAPIERLKFSGWRSRLRQRISGERALEVGVGTGKNLLYYPEDVKITAIDFSPKMLAKARKRARHMGIIVELIEMDVQHLEFPDQFFDTIFATFVFCSVPDPVAGLREIRRVCKPDGRLLLLEHMRPERPVMGFIFDILNPAIFRITGANINRKTMDNIRQAGWKVEVEEKLSADVVRWIEAVPE